MQISSFFPTSKDIYIELDGQKVAVVESYQTKSSRESRYIEAFGHDEPVGTIPGRTKYIIELSRVYVTRNALDDGIKFHDLADFNLVIVKPDRRIVFSDCQWSEIVETASINDVVLEKAIIVASHRSELSI